MKLATSLRLVLACCALAGSLLPASGAEVQFTEISERAGVRLTHDPLGFISGASFPHQNSVGTGVAAVDINGDGWMDFIITNGTTPGHYCFLNNGDGTFSDVSAAMSIWPGNVGNGIVCADIDNNGRPDAFIANHMAEADLLFGTNYGLSAQGKRFGLKDYRFVGGNQPPQFGYEGPLDMSVAYGDYDADGYLDAYVANYLFAGDVLWHNLAGGQFINSNSVPEPLHGYGCTPVFLDYDDDGDQDIFVVNDLMRDFLWRNDGPRRAPVFTEVALESRIAGGNTTAAELSMGMGAAVADFDNDLDEDIYVTNFRANALWLNPGDWSHDRAWFHNVAPERNVDFKLNSWGCAFFDANNDGNQDLFMVGGWVLNGPDDQPREIPNRFWLNKGPPNYDFKNISGNAGVTDTQFGRSQAVADFDRDGDLDIFVTNCSYYELGTIGMEPPVEGHTLLFRNDSQNDNSWVNFLLQGAGPHETGRGCTRDAVGATVFVTTQFGKQMRVVRAGSGYMGQNSLELEFGLGAATMIDKVEVEWPCGLETSFEGVLTNQHYRIVEAETALISAPVVLENFSIVPSRSGLTLQWRNAPGLQITNFEIQRESPAADPEETPGFEILELSVDYDGVQGTALDANVVDGGEYSYRLLLTDRFGNLTASAELRVVAKLQPPSREPVLGQNFPNPFNPSTKILFSLPSADHVSIVLFDIHGRRVRNLYEADLPAGTDYEVEWNGNDEAGKAVASGVYYYSLQTEQGSQSRRLTLIR